jgi:hypothetical protein
MEMMIVQVTIISLTNKLGQAIVSRIINNLIIDKKLNNILILSVVQSYQ